MSKTNYTAMSDQELRHYFLRNRQDQEALKIYFNRLNQRPKNIITTVDDPDFEKKIEAVVLDKIKQTN